MVTGRRSLINRRQTEIRKRKQFIRWISLFIKVTVVVVIVFHFRNIYTCLEEIQVKLEHFEIQQYGKTQTNVDTKIADESSDVDYEVSLGTWEVDKPEERTETEVLNRLDELGQGSFIIGQICQNQSQYPKEILAALANNPEMADFVAKYPGTGKETGGITVSEKEQEFPLFLQWDLRWGYVSYGENCIGLAGCGPTCLSMMLFYLTRDEQFTPDKIAAYSMENGYYVEGTGTSWALMEDVPKLHGIKVTSISPTASNMRAALENNGIIICALRKGDFTLSGHYIVIYGCNDEGFLIRDPNCVARSNRQWTFSEIENQIKSIWVYNK